MCIKSITKFRNDESFSWIRLCFKNILTLALNYYTKYTLTDLLWKYLSKRTLYVNKYVFDSKSLCIVYMLVLEYIQLVFLWWYCTTPCRTRNLFLLDQLLPMTKIEYLLDSASESFSVSRGCTVLRRCVASFAAWINWYQWQNWVSFGQR